MRLLSKLLIEATGDGSHGKLTCESVPCSSVIDEFLTLFLRGVV